LIVCPAIMSHRSFQAVPDGLNRSADAILSTGKGSPGIIGLKRSIGIPLPCINRFEGFCLYAMRKKSSGTVQWSRSSGGSDCAASVFDIIAGDGGIESVRAKFVSREPGSVLRKDAMDRDRPVVRDQQRDEEPQPSIPEVSRY